jgi:hypothetical protein
MASGFCPRCGASRTSPLRFCPSCGTDLEAASLGEVRPTAQPAAAPGSTAPSPTGSAAVSGWHRSRRKGLGALAMLAVLLLIGAGAFTVLAPGSVALTTFDAPGFSVGIPSNLGWGHRSPSGLSPFDSWDSPDGTKFIQIVEIQGAQKLGDVIDNIRAAMGRGETNVSESAVSLGYAEGWRIAGKRPTGGSTGLVDFVYYAVYSGTGYDLLTLGVPPSDVDAMANSFVVR